MNESIKTIMDWHQQTFKDTKLESQMSKYEDEEAEFRGATPESKEELMELADLTIVACGIMRFDGLIGFTFLKDVFDKLSLTKYSPAVLWDAVEQKMLKNRNRVWQKHGGKYQHKPGVED